MNAAILFKHFNRISEAHDAPSKLKRFILDLAFRGKLVDQDPRDEPASELLKRIRTARGLLAQRVERKRRDTRSTFLADEHNLALPKGWTSAALGELVTVINGRAYSRSELLDEGTPVLRVGNLFTSRHWYYSNLELEPDKYCDEDDLIYAWSASFGPFIWPGPKVIYHYHIWKLTLHSDQDLEKRYLYWFLQQKTEAIKAAGHGVSMLHMTKEKMECVQVPLPPVTEQRRIVTRVDELMRLCNQFEEAQREREVHRRRLTAAVVNGLGDVEGSRRTALVLFSHFRKLVMKKDQIELLKRSVFNLGVCGRLTSRNPADRPASELLMRIHRESTAPFGPSDVPCGKEPFQIPAGWSWVPFGKLVKAADSGWSPRTEAFARSDGNWGVIKVSAVSWERFLPEENKQLLPGVIPPERTQIHKGDFLISRANTSELVAKCVVVDDEPAQLILSDKIVRLEIHTGCNKHYLALVNNHATYARAYYAEQASGTSLSMKNVSRDVIYALPIPLPPEAEQDRIVAKLSKVMEICDGLERQIAGSEMASAALLEAVLQRALDDGDAIDFKDEGWADLEGANA